jgi:hypothetical protein
MKKILFVLLLVPALAWAQPKAGSFLIGTNLNIGNFGGNSTGSLAVEIGKITSTSPFGPDQESDISNFSINPLLGYTVIDGFVLGLNIGYSYSKREGDNSNFLSTKSNTISAGPFASYYFDAGPVKPLISLNTSFGRGTSELEGNGFSDEATFETFQVRTGVGAAYFANEHISIEGLIGYNYSEFNREEQVSSDNNTSTFFFNIGIGVFLTRHKSEDDN